MAKQYFRAIVTFTGGPDEININICRRQHEEKLNNYLVYGEPYTNATLPVSMNPLPPERAKEVESQSTATSLTDHKFMITTILCCENEYEERTEG